MAETTDLYSIVVAGAMNPRIHHPSWYQVVGILSEAETKAATEDGSLLCLPMLARFRAAEFVILAQVDRWEIQTADLKVVERMLQLTGRVFDEFLIHTPVTSFGLNVVQRRSTQVVDVGAHLASVLANASLGLLRYEGATAQFTVQVQLRDPDRVVQQVVSAAPDIPGVLILNQNVHYPIEGVQGHFDLGPRLRLRWEPDLKQAQEQSDRIVVAINQRVGP